MPDVLLEVDGTRYCGWKSVRITRSIEQVAGSFELSVTESSPSEMTMRRIREGSHCNVSIAGEPIITGYVDDWTVEEASERHKMTVSGRDRTADLVDSSAVHSPGEWRNQTIAQIAATLCEPFGITIKTETDVGDAFAKFSLQEGETVFAALERAARLRGLLLMSDGVGSLVITRASNSHAQTQLVMGQNILSATTLRSQADRFSHYTCKGQTPCDDWSDVEGSAGAKALATDTAITRYRPLIVMAEGSGDQAALQRRADWERNVRRGRGNRITATVQGWLDGKVLWKPNRLVRYENECLNLNLFLLIAGVTFSLDNSGTRTELSLADPEAFDVEPPQPGENKNKW